MSGDGEEGRQPRGLRAHDIEQPDLSSEDDMSSSDSNESVEGTMMHELDKKRKKVEQEGCFDEDDEPCKQTDEDTLTTVTYDSDGEADEDDDPSKFVPSPGPRRPKVLVPLDFAWLTISSLGIVYGDLGTSPLYTWPTILGNLETYEEDDLVGAMCLLLYSLLAIVTIKYATFVMMADNKGEGGIFALTSLVPPTRKHIKAWKRGGDPPPRYMVWTKRACMCLCIIGAGFIMGDGAITPAVSVLSAIEGLGVVNDKVVDYEVIMGITVLGLLFISQPFGSSRIAFLFGPIMLVWFAFIGAVGIYNIVTFDSSVFRAFNPYWGYLYFARRGVTGYKALGGVCLCFTGVEALYADMGHFGRWPIRVGWALIVLPSVLMSYFGQLSYIITHPGVSGPIFFESVPSQFYWPMLVVATMAAVIGSQSLISATFSLISQAIGLEAFPPVALHHTSAALHGQVYAPTGNWLLMATSIGLVLFFQSSSALASAFGIAVTGTMAITTLIFVSMVVLRWHWSAWFAVPIGALFFFVEMVYFSANMAKFNDGGWVALLLAAMAIAFMGSWKLGRVDVVRCLAAKTNHKTMRDVVRWTNDVNVQRVPGTGVFLGSDEETVPKSLLQHFKIHRSLPTTVVTVHTKTIDLPHIKPEAHLSCRAIGPGLVKLTVRRGFVERRTDTSEVLQQAEHAGVLKTDPKSPRFFYFISRQTVVLREARRFWSRVRLGLYNFMVMIARPPACVSMVIPHNRRIEYHSELVLSKPLPGDNPISRFINQSPRDHQQHTS